jgi:uncharacterized protein
VTRSPATEADLYRCQVVHTRLGTRRRCFSYRSYLWLVDLDRMPELPPLWRPLASFRVQDHLADASAASIRSNVDAYLADQGIDITGGRVLMLASAATFGYVFNPLSVFWCYDEAGALAAVLAEVHNTYGQRHVYFVGPDQGGHGTAAKEFYVSPFLPMHGNYRMRLPEPGDSLRLGVTLMTEGRPLLAATVNGSRQPLTLRRLAACSLRFPLAPLRVSLLIRWQGIRLFARRFPLTPRPAPTSASTEEVR